MINRGQQPAPDEQHDLIGKIAAETGTTPGVLLGRPESTEAPASDLLAEAQRRLPEAGAELVSERVADAIEGAPFMEWSEEWTRNGNMTGEEPTQLIADYASEIKERLGADMKASDVAEWWNKNLKDWFDELERADDAQGRAVVDFLGLLVSDLMNECMIENDDIALNIPDGLKFLHNIGRRLRCGRLEVNGDVGNYFGESASGSAELVLNGEAGSFVGSYADQAAKIIVNGNARSFVGSYAQDNAVIVVSGQVEGSYGEGLSGDAILEIGGVKPNFLNPPGLVDHDWRGQVIVGGEPFEMPRYR